MLFCSRCGSQLGGGARFCSACGAPVAGAVGIAQGGAPMVRLERSRNDRMLAGVCAGIAHYYGWDLTWVRVVAVVLAFFSGVGLVGYVVLWLVMPEQPWMLSAPASSATVSSPPNP